jgi:tripartite-type tricarboxylate transporter receptor subunit TctC
LSSAAFVISAALHRDLSYDALRDFAGVTRIGFSTQALVVAPALGVKTVKDFIALAQAKPGQILFSSAGAGSSTHMNGERFRLAAGIKVVHVGFKGASDAMNQGTAEELRLCLRNDDAGGTQQDTACRHRDLFRGGQARRSPSQVTGG